jgi:hypothetical protein
MGPLHFLLHAMNFVAPALFLALLLPALNRWVMRQPAGLSWWAQALILFAVGLSALLGGLAFFGTDGKMLSYAALVLVCASTQWGLSRGWK